ncbi:MAG: hypothetical protein JOY71_07560 [Acetobacteraceae bacterium]|nr:hypothetical protein [Acetobacteraceae bacterium]MBV8521967.1 hypothetical protein [Acetobacteraceae bacterium]
MRYEVASVIVLAYGTSWHALLDHTGLVAAETVLVLGAAAGGLAAIDIAKTAGARVIAAASSQEKLDICK